MRLRHRELRLELPSLFQINKLGDKGGEDWCGRTSASMIYNYYMAARAGGMENALAELIVNQRDRAPYDLVHSDGKVAVDGYNLLATMQRAKPEGWAYDESLEGPPAIYPVAARRSTPEEHEILQILRPVLTSLELHNPVLFYSSLSSNATTPRHIVVISGYRVGPDGGLWLHIDDPGSEFRLDDGRMTTWTTAGHVMSGTDEEVLVQLVPKTHDTAAGRRYWLRASRLFQPNHHSARDDLWCDHCDRPGFCVYYNTVSPEPISACVLTSSQDPGLPIDLHDPDGRGLPSTLPIAWENARRSGAPYPMGTNRAWHNGIHFVYDEATFASQDVLSVAPGELVFVRLPERAPTDVEDAGAVLVRHGFDPATQCLHDPRRDTPAPRGTIWIYSLYMHLQGGDAGARHLLAKLDHGEKPKLRELVPAPAECTLFGYDPEGELVALEATFAPGREVPGEETFAIATPAGRRLALRADAQWSNLDAWEDGPRAPLAPAGATKGVYDPLTGKVVELKAAVSSKEQIPLEVTCGEDDVWAYVIVDEGKTTWLHAEGEAGLQLHDFAHCVHDLSDKKIFAGVPEGYAIAFLRGPELTIQVHDAKLLEGKLYVPGGTEHVRCREDRSQPALGRRADDGASLWPELEPCIAVSDDAKKAIDAADEPVTPKGAKLCYLNPTTGHVLATNLTLRGAKIRRDAAGRWTKDGKHARLEGHAPEISIQRARACAHDRGDIDDLLRFKDRMWPLLTCWDDKAAIFTRTDGTGEGRSFPDDSRLPLEGAVFRMSLVEGPCTTSDRLRAWARLPLVVGLDKDARKAKEDELAATFQGPAADTLRRVGRGESRLLGAQLRRSEGWEVKDGVLTVQEGRTAPLQLFVEIAGKGKGRYFPEKLTACDKPIVSVPAAPGMRLRLVSTFTSGAKTPVARALVEVVATVPTSALKNNEDEREAWDEEEEFVRSVREAIAGGGVVDLGELEARSSVFARGDHPFARWRQVGHDPIAAMGLVGVEQVGVHVELFAGENVLPSDGPIGLWREIRVTSGAEPLSKEFYAEVVSAILEDARLAALAKGERDGTGTVDSGKSGEPAPAEQWRRFCAKEEVDRGLSRIIAVHPSEWMTDWEAAAQQYKLTRYLKGPTAGWWPRDIALEGLSSPDWYFHHPLRLLEWLTTGVDVRVELCSSKTTATKLELAGELYEMSASDAGEDGEIFRIRTVVGDRAESMEAFAVLEGVDTLEPRIPVALERGEIVRLWLCEPTASMDFRVLPSRVPSAVALRFADTLAREDTGTTHLLADSSPHLSPCGHGRATFEIEARYNVTMPDTLELELGDPAFTIASVEIGGTAPLPESVARTGTKLTIPLAPSGPAPTLITMYRKVTARVDVVASESVGVETTLTATVSGGDLVETQTRTGRIATRVVGEDARGQDVAKLQHYLRQIMVDGVPCLRLPENAVPTIDGHYGELTARAIWRFVLHFRASPQWDRSLSEIAASTRPLPLDPFEAPASGAIDTAADAAFAEHGFPEVDAPLIAEIVRHYGMPSVLPAVELVVVEPVVDADLVDTVRKMGAAGKTRVPCSTSLGTVATARLTVALVKPVVPGDPASVAVSIVTAPGFPYRIVGAGTRTLADLMVGGIVLEPSGSLTTEKAACTLQLVASGVTLATLRLGGTRDLGEGGDSERSLDALCVQSWLRRWPKPDGKPYYGGTLDGQWGGGSTKALAAWKGAVAPGATYVEMLELLAAGPSAGAKEAAQ